MQDKSLQLVSYEQAQKLKELGFNWECKDCYIYDDELNDYYLLNLITQDFNNNKENKYDYTSAPSIALALKWFRDERGIKCYVINGEANMGTYYFNDEWDGTIEYATYEECESALLDKLIELEMSKEVADGRE